MQRLCLLLALLTLAPACAAPRGRKRVQNGVPTHDALDKPEKGDDIAIAAVRSAQLLAAAGYRAPGAERPSSGRGGTGGVPHVRLAKAPGTHLGRKGTRTQQRANRSIGCRDEASARQRFGSLLTRDELLTACISSTSSVLAPDAQQERVVPARGGKRQQPRGSQAAAKGNGARAPPSFHANTQLMKPKAFHANADALLAWHARRPTPPEQCKWSQTEVLLKANVQLAQDEPLASGWVLAWLWNMECFPRLHVVLDREPTASLARIYGRVPNQTFHRLQYPFAARGRGAKRNLPFMMQMDVFWRIQWPMLWADNFTTAPFVMVLDSDSPLTMPLRCHHIFDQELPSLPVWHSWQWPNPPQWSISADAIVRNMAGHGAKLPFPKGLDFMTFFPVTQHVESAIPFVLPHVAYRLSGLAYDQTN